MSQVFNLKLRFRLNQNHWILIWNLRMWFTVKLLSIELRIWFIATIQMNFHLKNRKVLRKLKFLSLMTIIISLDSVWFKILLIKTFNEFQLNLLEIKTLKLKRKPYLVKRFNQNLTNDNRSTGNKEQSW